MAFCSLFHHLQRNFVALKLRLLRWRRNELLFYRRLFLGYYCCLFRHHFQSAIFFFFHLATVYAIFPVSSDALGKILKYFPERVSWHLFLALVVICIVHQCSSTCISGGNCKVILYVCGADAALLCAKPFFFCVLFCFCNCALSIMKTKSKNCMHIWCFSLLLFNFVL